MCITPLLSFLLSSYSSFSITSVTLFPLHYLLPGCLFLYITFYLFLCLLFSSGIGPHIHTLYSLALPVPSFIVLGSSFLTFFVPLTVYFLNTAADAVSPPHSHPHPLSSFSFSLHIYQFNASLDLFP